MAHLELAELYEDKGELRQAYNEYRALYYTIPSEVKFYTAAARLLLQMNEFTEAKQLLLRSLNIKETYFANKWCGQIYLRDKDVSKAILFLEKARKFDQNDPQLLFNLSRAYLSSGNQDVANKYYNQLSRTSPDSEYTRYLRKALKISNREH